MFSMPPATTMSTSPARIICEAIATALRPEPQTMLIVVAGTSFGMPAPIATWRAGFCPSPAVRTQPSTTSSTSSPAISARSSAARTACAPSSVAAMSLNCPPKLPTGVRSALTITASSIMASSDEGHLIRAPRPSIRFSSGFAASAPVALTPVRTRLRLLGEQAVAVDDGGGDVDELAVGGTRVLAQHLEGAVRR